MAFNLARLESDALAMENDLPATVTINGVDYPCSEDEAGAELRMMAAGYDGKRRENIWVRVSVFGATPLPDKRSSIQLNGVEWQIEGESRISQDKIHVVIPLVQST